MLTVLSDRERAELIGDVERCIIDSPITVDDILELIELAGLSARYGTELVVPHVTGIGERRSLRTGNQKGGPWKAYLCPCGHLSDYGLTNIRTARSGRFLRCEKCGERMRGRIVMCGQR